MRNSWGVRRIVPILVAVVLALPIAISPAAGQQTAGRQNDPNASPSDIAIDYVGDHRGDLGLTAADVADIRVTDVYESAHNGVTHVYLGQQLEGLDVSGAAATVNVAEDGSVLSVGNRLVDLGRASGRTALGAAGAVEEAASALGIEAKRDVAVLDRSGGTARATKLTKSGISAQRIPARLVYQPTDDGLRLAWQVEIAETSGEHYWDASIDAATGELLSRTDYVDHDNLKATAAAVGTTATTALAPPGGSPLGDDNRPARYRVFPIPLESPLDGERKLVNQPEEVTASPFGWHDTDGATGPEFTVTRGNNVHAYTDHDDDNQPDPGSDPDGGTKLKFDFPIDFTEHPHTYSDAAVTNLFYWNNIIHDVFYLYGFTEEAGNFQVNNYGRGGVGDDDVRAEGQDGGGMNNANFFTPADGSRPRMQMYLWDLGLDEPVRDGDLDSGIIMHEYGHGISNRLTGGPSQASCLRNEEQMGEGWSDWLALALQGRASDDPESRGIGNYALFNESRNEEGIRPTPYSTNLDVNPTTYGDIPGLAVPHGVGYAWATMLWDVYWDLIDEHGFNADIYDSWDTGGNNLATQLVMDGMKFQPCRPGFVDGRDAILTADEALTDGANQCIVWDAFARRGLGFSADQGSSEDADDGTEAFDTHPDCE